MSASNRSSKVPIKFLLWGLIATWWLFVVPKVSAQTYDFDEGIEVVTKGLISENKAILKNKKIAVFGIIESKSREKWEISSHIEDGIVDALVNNGYRVIERRRIQDVIKKEIKKVTDQWFDQARVAQFGKLVGADFVVTGRYVLWGQGMLKISIRAINVADGEIVAADKVKVHTDRIANLLKSEEKKKHVKEAKVSPEKPAVEPATESKKTTFSINANVSDAKVLVDGREIGRTPLSDVTVSPGERKITVEKQGYEPYRKTILLGKGRSMSLYVDLREAGPRKGRLYVETEPRDANVKILNIGPKFDQGMELVPGSYHVEASKQGYRTQEKWVDLKAGENKRLEIRLEQFQASIQPATTYTRPSSSTSNVMERDGIYVAHANGIVKDTKTGLEWKAGPDRGTNWDEARSWVQSLINLDGGGWRMPTLDELAGLYKDGTGSHNMTSLFKMSGWDVWAGETKGSSYAECFAFGPGDRYWGARSYSRNARGFAVRSRNDG